ncbi:MAG: helix-turn-helix domain-containing protein [Pyrinomonadaceae bacterium]
MTIDDLVREVGIGEGSVYIHFSSKEEIVLLHVDRIVECVKDRLKIIAEKQISQEEKLREMIFLRVLFHFQHLFAFYFCQ